MEGDGEKEGEEEIVGEGMEKREGHSKKGERERDKEEKRKTFAQTK